MANWPPDAASGRVRAWGTDSANSRAVRITLGATPNVKTGWVEVASSTPAPATAVLLTCAGYSHIADLLVDVAVGGAGSEQVVLENLQFSMFSRMAGRAGVLPLAIPAGSRVSARAQSSDASAVLELGFHGWVDPDFGSGLRATTYGANTADSGGAAVTGNSTVNIEGAFVELTSNSNPVRLYYVCVGAQNASRGNTHFRVDIAAGAGGSEQVFCADLFSQDNSVRDWVTPGVFGPFRADIPAATRLSARVQTNVSSQSVDVVFIGFD